MSIDKSIKDEQINYLISVIKENYITQITTSGNVITIFKGDGSISKINLENTEYDVANADNDGLMSSTDKVKLDSIAIGANNYSLPEASSTNLGGVRIGNNITVNEGNISLIKENITNALGYTPPTSDTKYMIASSYENGLMSSTDKNKLNGIAENANNYSLPEASSTNLGGVRVGNNITVNGGNISLIKENIVNALGYTPSNTDTVYTVATASSDGLMSSTDKNKLNSIDENANNYSLPIASSTTLGGIKIGNNITLNSGIISLLKENIVNALGYTPSNTDTVYTVATELNDGLMSSLDKSKLEGIAENANNYSLPIASSTILGGVRIGSNITLNNGSISLTKNDVTNALGYIPPTSNIIYNNATNTSSGLMSSSDKSKLDDIDENANNYLLPEASSTTLGGVRVGDNITVSSGSISLNTTNITNALGYEPSTKEIIYTATISSTLWISTTAPYNQTIAIPGITSTDKPIVDIALSDSDTYDTIQGKLDSYSKIFRIVTLNDGITVYSTDKTTYDVPIQLRITR